MTGKRSREGNIFIAYPPAREGGYIKEFFEVYPKVGLSLGMRRNNFAAYPQPKIKLGIWENFFEIYPKVGIKSGYEKR